MQLSVPYKNRVTGVWEHDFRRGGLRLHLSYGVRTKREADPLHEAVVALFRAREFPLIERLRAGTISAAQVAELRASGRPFSVLSERPAVPWPSLADAVGQYVDALAANTNRADSTARQAATQLRSFIAFAGEDTALDAVTSSTVIDYQASLVAQGKAVNTVTAYVARVGSLYQWCIRREAREARETKRSARVLYVPLDPERISTKRTRRARYLTEPEAERLLAAAPPHYRFPVAAGLFAGLRVSEMTHLRPAFDVDLTLGMLTVQEQPGWSPKTARSRRHVPLSADLRPILTEHLARYASDEWVVPALRDPSLPFNAHTFVEVFARIVRDAELVDGRRDPKGVTFHTLRHTFASWLAMRGVNLLTVADLLGDRLEEVARTYAHLSPDHRQRAVDALKGAVRLPEALP